MRTVGELMTRVGTFTVPDQALSEVLALMRRNRHSCAVVLHSGRVVGLISERDLVGTLADRMLADDRRDCRVADVMTPQPVCASPEDSLLTALQRSLDCDQRQLPVVNERGGLEGIITQTDMAKAYIQSLARQDELINANRALKQESLRDSLLNIGNRRAMEHDLSSLDAQPRPRFALALLDLDAFKKYNDCYGHLAGDRALQQASQAIQSCLRQEDSLYRYGGEELLLLMMDTDLEGAWRGVNRVREVVQELRIEHRASDLGVLTLSAGVACDAALDINALIAEADRALYRAKTAGRNRVVNAIERVPVAP